MSSSVPSPSAGATPATAPWLRRSERGTLVGIRLAFFFATALGRAPARVLVVGIALWYAAFDRHARRVSARWLETVHGAPARWRDVYGHILRFTQVTLDRIFLLQGKTGPFVFSRTGPEHLHQAVRGGRGAILLGAHLGSFEAMRAGGDQDALPIHIVGHFDNARMINALFERLNPDLAARVIHVGRGDVDFIFAVQRCIEDGQLVAILGDRVGLGEKSVEVEFFGRPARFPTGPFTLAAVLKCPMLLTFGLYREPNRYDLHCEPFADQIVLPRRDREEHLRAWAQRYARKLEIYCRRAPDNWFNFFDVWRD